MNENNKEEPKKIASIYQKEMPKAEPKKPYEYCDCPNCTKLYNHLLAAAKKYMLFRRNMGDDKETAEMAIAHFCGGILISVEFFINHEKADEMSARVLEGMGFPPPPLG